MTAAPTPAGQVPAGQVPAGQHTVRRHNAQLVLAALARDSASRAVLAQRTGLTKSTVSSLVDSLIAQRVLIEGSPEAGGPGRPSRPVSLNPNGLLAMGIEINVDYLAAGLLDLTGQIRRYKRVEVDNRGLGAAEILATAVGLATNLSAASAKNVLGAAIAVPGVVGPDGEVIRAPNLPQLTGYGVLQAAERALPGQVRLIENEANCGALAWQRARHSDALDFVYVSGEIGVGSGIVLQGSLFRGVHGFAGELGHVVVERDGPSCACGGQGCVEQYAGMAAVLRSSGQVSVAALRRALDSADERAVAAVANAGSALGVGLSSMLNVLDVPLVVLGGMYADLFTELEPSLSAQLRRRALSRPGLLTGVRRGTLGADAAVRGAGGLVIDQALADPEALPRAS